MRRRKIVQKGGDLNEQLRAHLVWHDRHADNLAVICRQAREMPGLLPDVEELRDLMNEVEAKLGAITAAVNNSNRSPARAQNYH